MLNGGTYIDYNNLRSRGRYWDTNSSPGKISGAGIHGVGLIQTTRNIGIYRPRVFHARYRPNQSYSPEFDWECLLSPSTERWWEVSYVPIISSIAHKTQIDNIKG